MLKLYAIRKDNMYLYLRYIDGDWDIPSPGDYYGAVRVEQVYWSPAAGITNQYWTSNLTLDNLSMSKEYVRGLELMYDDAAVVTYNLVEE